MAVVVIGHVPGGTAEQDDALQQRMGLAANPPAGAQLRVAGPVADGFRVITVWDSRESFETFLRDRLAPAFADSGREPPRFEISEIHSVRVLGS